MQLHIPHRQQNDNVCEIFKSFPNVLSGFCLLKTWRWRSYLSVLFLIAQSTLCHSQNLFEGLPRQLNQREMRIMRYFALALITDYVPAKDMYYYLPTSKTRSTRFKSGGDSCLTVNDYHFAELINVTKDCTRRGSDSTLASLYRECGPKCRSQTAGGQLYAEYTGSGTTCGFLCHWLMWRLGVRDEKITVKTLGKSGAQVNVTIGLVNRGAPGYEYHNGFNIACITSNRNFIKRGTTPYNQSKPKLGDIIWIDTETYQNAHVFVYLGEKRVGTETYWITAESGQDCVGEIDRQCSYLKMRKMYMSGNTIRVEDELNRPVQGWLPLENLTFSGSLPDVPRYYRENFGITYEYPVASYDRIQAALTGNIYNHNLTQLITDPRIKPDADDVLRLVRTVWDGLE